MSQERFSFKSPVIKERVYQQQFSLGHGKAIILNMTMQLLKKPPLTAPALQLFASVKHAYGTPPGQVDAPPHLLETEYAAQQYQLTKQVAGRVKTLSGKELEQFQKGGYIGIGCMIPATDLVDSDKKM